MRSLKFLDRQAGYSLSAIGLLVALVAPGLVPAFASADVVTTRSIEMSSTAADASSVSYKVTFNAVTANTKHIVVDFCGDSPIVGEACGAITGFDASAATTSDSGFSIDTAAAHTVSLSSTTDLSTSTPTVFTLTGIHNPTAAGSFYARVLTYTDANSTDYSSYAATSEGNYSDEGGIALATTDAIGVSGKVLETLTFCAAGEDITTSCDNPTNAGHGVGGAWLAPSVQFGTDGVLSSDAVSTASIYTDISTNASSGAVVSLKSNAVNCGGLLRSGSTACDIGPATAGITFGNALFGLTVPTASAATGTVQIAGTGATPYYDASTYKMHYVDANSGVTSTYGDPVLDTAGAPVKQGKSTLTFGASISDTTPAGRYSADLSLIATGKF